MIGLGIGMIIGMIQAEYNRRRIDKQIQEQDVYRIGLKNKLLSYIDAYGSPEERTEALLRQGEREPFSPDEGESQSEGYGGARVDGRPYSRRGGKVGEDREIP